MHKFRGRRSFCRFGIESLQGGRGAFSRFDIRIDVTICRIRLSVAQNAANLRQRNVRTDKPRCCRVAQIVEADIIQSCRIACRREASFDVIKNPEDHPS